MFESVFGSEMPLAARFAIAFAILLVFVAGIVWAIIRWLSPRRVKVSSVPPEPPVEIAQIIERVEFSFGGSIAVIMLIVLNVTALFAYYSSTTILQETVAVLSAISASVFWGVCAIIGRKRTYKVYRTLPPDRR